MFKMVHFAAEKHMRKKMAGRIQRNVKPKATKKSTRKFRQMTKCMEVVFRVPKR